MTQQLTSITPLGSHPYLTIDEYKQAPTAVDVDDLVGGGSVAINDVELSNNLARASSWVDGFCGQVLAATSDTETMRARVSRDGFLRLHPRFWPVASVVSCSFGSTPQTMTTLDPTTCWIEQMAVVFPLRASNASFLGPIQFSGNYVPFAEQFVSITYVNGYANAALSSNTSSGVTSLPVSDITGFVPGLRFTVYDGEHTEQLTVASNMTVGSGAGNVLLAAATTDTHNANVSVSALPPAVKLATIYMTNVILKSRGNAALVMSSLIPNEIRTNNPSVASDWDAATQLLMPYRRVR